MNEASGDPWRTADEPDGTTALADEDKDGLKPAWVATRGDLNAAEATNIAKALTARRWQSATTGELLDDLALRQLHRALFGDVWKWAGDYRRLEKNIGCDPVLIAVKVRDLCQYAKFWFTDAQLPVDVAGCRFHHALVSIHPFANGNGRHARAATDLLLRSLGEAPFSWGQANLVEPSATRHEYIAALRAADAGNHGLLLAFVRS